jgi:hypothetical protein
MTTVKIKSKAGEFIVSPSAGGKSILFKWNKSNDFTLDVPLNLEYTHEVSRKKIVTFENYPQFLLDNYSDQLELVSIDESPIVKQKKPKQEKVQ